MELAINWQDDDSSTSKAIKKIFPEAEVVEATKAERIGSNFVY